MTTEPFARKLDLHLAGSFAAIFFLLLLKTFQDYQS